MVSVRDTTVLMIGALALTLIACGGRPKPPRRAVYEEDVGGWSFRRYQALLDVEVWVPKNRAAAHTASYVHPEGLKRGSIGAEDVVNVVVIRYKKEPGILRALIKFARRLAQESRYQVEEKKIGGVRVFEVRGSGEAWAIWASDRHIVKVGGRGRESIPKSVVQAYAKPYPSRVKEDALEGPLPEGLDVVEPKREVEPFDEDNPEPDWERADAEKKKKKKKKKTKKKKKKEDDDD